LKYSKPQLIWILFDVISELRYRWKITKTEHIQDATANFCWSKTNWLMYLHWHIRLVTACSRQLWTILSS